MQERNLLRLSIKDFFTAEILKLALFPLLITLFVMYVLFFIAADFGLDQFSQAQLHIEHSATQLAPDGTVHTETRSEDYVGSGILTWLLQFSATSWIVSFLVYTVGTLIVMQLSVIIALFIIGFLTPWIVPIIQRRHYSDISIKGFGTIGEVSWHFIKTFFITLGLFILLMPLYFIPLIGILAFNIPFYYLFHKLLNFDVGSTICSKEEYFKIMYHKGNAIRVRTLLMYLLSLVPYVAIFSVVFFVVYLSHIYFSALKELQTSNTISDAQAPI